MGAAGWRDRAGSRYRDRRARGRGYQTFKGGTRQFTTATGSLSSTVTVRAVLARNPDGSCSFEHEPLHEVDLITATGTLSF